MSEQTVAESTATENTPETVESPAETVESFDRETAVRDLTDLERSILAKLSDAIAEANGIVAELKANSTNLADRLESLYESDDETAVRMRTEIEKVEARLASLREKREAHFRPIAESAIAEVKDSPVVKSLTDKRKATDAGVDALVKSLGLLIPDESRRGTFLKLLPKRSTLRGTSNVAASATNAAEPSIRRPRGFRLTVDPGPNGDGTVFENFSDTAKYLGVPTDQLQRIYFDAIGTTDSAQYRDATFSADGADGKTHTVKAVKRS